MPVKQSTKTKGKNNKSIRATDKQKRFAEAYTTNGNNAHSAAITAGYSPKSAYVIGSDLKNSETIQSLIGDAVRIGMDTLIDVAMNSKVDVARVNAANALVDRGLGKARMNDADQKRIPNITLVFNRVDSDDSSSKPEARVLIDSVQDTPPSEQS